MSQPTQPALGLSSHNNHYLFSAHYLNEIFRRDPAWREARESARPLLVRVRELAGAVRGLSELVRVYWECRPRYTELSGRLATTDALIDQVVYRLYGLSEEEVAIVESKR